MRRLMGVVLGAAMALAAVAVRAQPVEIEYWQYTFKQRVEAMDELIAQFQDRQPRHHRASTRTCPTTITAPASPPRSRRARGRTSRNSSMAGSTTTSRRSCCSRCRRRLQHREIDRDFFPIVQRMKVDGRYYALPTAVRSLALFWNKKVFQKPGSTRRSRRQTLDELVDHRAQDHQARRIGQPAGGGHRARHGRAGPRIGCARC